MGSENKKTRGGQSRYGGGDVNPNDIVSETDMIVERGNYQTEIDDVLTVSQDLINEYGQDVPFRSLQTAVRRT